jgi:transcriptional regulator with XRE-family HTH domain
MEKSGGAWGPGLVAAVAAEVRRYRQLRQLSVKELADRCAKLGWPIKRSVLSNLELSYRETVTVPEILILAAALNVAPVLLLFPVGRQEQVEYLPDSAVSPWDAAKWFSGQSDRPDATPLDNDERVYRLPVQAYADHEHNLNRLSVVQARAKDLRQRARNDVADPDAVDFAEELVEQYEQSLTRLRQEMRDQGLRAPESTPGSTRATRAR